MTDELTLEAQHAAQVEGLLRELADTKKRLDHYESSPTDRPPAIATLPPDEDTSPGSENNSVVWLIQKQKGMMSALVEIKERMDSDTPPPWAEKYFGEQVNLALRLEAMEQAQKKTEERLSRLACWKSTEPPPCPIMDVIDGGKTGE